MAGSDRLPFGLTRPPGPWRAPDRLLVAYASAAALPLAYGALRGIPRTAAQLAVNVLVVVAAVLVARTTARTRRPAALILRLAYVPLLFWAFYHQIEVIWPILHESPFDAVFAEFDASLFGFQPSLAFREAFPSPILGELLCAAYFLYYFFTPVLLVAALRRGGYLAAERIVFATALCFYACYAFFWALPTVGPHFWFPPHAGPQPYPGFVFNRLLFFFTGHGEIRGGAFPSSHMAVATLLTLLARREAPRLFPAFAITTAVMAVAVVYLRAHYAVDVPAGIAVGVLFAAVARRAQRAIDVGLDPSGEKSRR